MNNMNFLNKSVLDSIDKEIASNSYNKRKDFVIVSLASTIRYKWNHIDRKLSKMIQIETGSEPEYRRIIYKKFNSLGYQELYKEYNKLLEVGYELSDLLFGKKLDSIGLLNEIIHNDWIYNLDYKNLINKNDSLEVKSFKWLRLDNLKYIETQLFSIDAKLNDVITIFEKEIWDKLEFVTNHKTRKKHIRFGCKLFNKFTHQGRKLFFLQTPDNIIKNLCKRCYAIIQGSETIRLNELKKNKKFVVK